MKLKDLYSRQEAESQPVNVDGEEEDGTVGDGGEPTAMEVSALGSVLLGRSTLCM